MSLPASLKGRRVLAVDDDEHTRNLLRDLCQSLGLSVDTADDGDAALERMRSSRPDLVLLDVMMPRRDGFSVLREMRASEGLKELPVIILTAMADFDSKVRGMELGADDYLPKPFRLVDLQTRVQSALRVCDYRQRLTAAEEELAQQRAVDPLTGAGTYRQLKASLDAEVCRSRRYGRPLAVLLLGLDDYTALRLQVGREGCDRLVAELARAVQALFRGADRLFRTDVDEFVMLLPETDLAGARTAAERLCATADELAGRLLGGHPSAARLRAAGALLPLEGTQSGEDLLREAYQVFRALEEASPPRFVFDA